MIEISLVLMVLPSFWTFGVEKIETSTKESDMKASCYTLRFGIIGLDFSVYRPTDCEQ